MEKRVVDGKEELWFTQEEVDEWDPVVKAMEETGATSFNIIGKDDDKD